MKKLLITILSVFLLFNCKQNDSSNYYVNGVSKAVTTNTMNTNEQDNTGDFRIAEHNTVFFGGLMQVSFTVGAFYIASHFYGMDWKGGLFIGFLVAWIVVKMRLAFWSKISGGLILFGVFLLVLVMVPGVGRSINGSSRWIGFGPLGMQVSEFVKLAVVLYVASYLVMRHQEVQTNVIGFIKPMILLAIIALLAGCTQPVGGAFGLKT